MSDWKAFGMRVTSDPLAGGFLVIATGAFVSRLMLRQHPTWRAIARVVFLALLTVLLSWSLTSLAEAKPVLHANSFLARTRSQQSSRRREPWLRNKRGTTTHPAFVHSLMSVYR